MVKKQQGFSTIEILIATAILVVVFSAVIMLVLGSQTLAVDSQINHAAQLLNEKYLEEARNSAIIDFNSSQITTAAVPSGSITYNVSRTQEYISPCIKKITSRIDWTFNGRAQYVSASTQVSNPAIVFLTGSECNTTQPPNNAWQNCYVYGDAPLSGPDQDAYDLDVTRINGHKYVFEVTHPKNGQHASDDLWVYNTDNEANPQLISQLDTNGVDDIGINSVLTVNLGSSKYAYLANDSSTNQLIILDVSDPAHLGTPSLFNIIGEGSNKISDIEFYNGRLYVAIGNDIKVYSLTNPLLPVLQNTDTFDGKVNKIAFNSSNNLYAAVSDSSGELAKFSLSSGTITKFNIIGNQEGTSISVLGTRVYLGTSAGVNQNNFYIFEDTTSGLTLLTSNNLPHQNNKKILDNVVLGRFLFVLIESANQEFQVYDISDINNFDQRCGNFNPSNIGTGFDYFEGYVYTAMQDNNELQIFSDHQ